MAYDDNSFETEFYNLSEADRFRRMATIYNEVADIIEENGLDDDVYGPAWYNSEFSQNVTKNTYVDGEYVTDKAGSKKAILAVMRKFRGMKNKELTEGGLEFTVKTPSGGLLKWHVAKDVTCKPKKITREWKEPYTIDGRWVEKVEEWECDDSLLAEEQEVL